MSKKCGIQVSIFNLDELGTQLMVLLHSVASGHLSVIKPKVYPVLISLSDQMLYTRLQNIWASMISDPHSQVKF